MYEKFSRICNLQFFPMSKSVFSPKIPTQNSAAIKSKTNVMDDEGFIHPAKSSKKLTPKTKNTPNINTENKFETLSNCLTIVQT